jgi:hypothetical protein
MPAAWHDLRVQLWSYGRIDKYQSAKVISLHAAFYDPEKDAAQEPRKLRPWHRGDEPFDSQCRTLFELYGGQVID